MDFRVRKLAAILPLFFLFFEKSALASDQKCKVGLIAEMHGEVLRESPLQAKVEHLKAGLCVSDGQALITRKNSGLGINLGSGSLLNITSESELLVGFPIGGKPTKLNLTRGEIKVRYTSSKEAPVVNLLRLSVTEKTPATVLLAEVFHDGQEAWLVVTHGSAIAKLGNEGSGVIVSAGQSVYVTESQKEVPRVVNLDEREMGALAEDHALKQTISQLLMVESGAENKPDSAVDSSQDLTLEQYAAQERADKQKAVIAPPPVVTNLPLVAMPNEKPLPRPTVTALEPAPRPIQPIVIPNEAAANAAAIQPPLLEKVVVEKTPKLSSIRIDVGPSFYSDASGFEIGANYLTSLSEYKGGDAWSVGAGLGYSHAGKNQLTVSNWKLAGIVNYRYNLLQAISLMPEFSLGAGIENVSFPLKTVNSGVALYYSPDLLFELNIDRSPHFHPGVVMLEQGYLGSTSLTSVATEFVARFEF